MHPLVYVTSTLVLLAVAAIVGWLTAISFANALILLTAGALVVGFAQYRPPHRDAASRLQAATQSLVAYVVRVAIGVAVIALIVVVLLSYASKATGA